MNSTSLSRLDGDRVATPCWRSYALMGRHAMRRSARDGRPGREDDGLYGACRDRTGDLRLAKAALSQLS